MTNTANQFDTHALGLEAYVYLYPLVTMELTRRQSTNIAEGQMPGRGPMNTFSSIQAFPDADWRMVVRPNFDTLYSLAWLDLSEGPIVVSVPDTDGRYYLLPILDMWTDVVASPGWRTTGTQASTYVIVPQGWDGDLPGDADVIVSPTPTVWIIGRTQTNGPADYEAVHAIQAGFTLAGLSGELFVPTQIDPSIDMETEPLNQVNSMSAVDYFTLGAELMAKHPPHHSDWSQLARMRHIGLVPGQSFDPAAMSAEELEALATVPFEAVARMKAFVKTGARVANGWVMNTDSIGVYGNFYLKRAAVALAGLGANQPEDAIYPLQITDADGQPANGSANYVLHMDADDLPPVDAFWSVTTYDEEGFQVANPIDRFAIGDRDPLQYNDDGSLDLLIQAKSPGTQKEEDNWLPAPTGPFSLCMRLYGPRPEALDGRWNPPPLRRL
jgi:hypothetical protein